MEMYLIDYQDSNTLFEPKQDTCAGIEIPLREQKKGATTTMYMYSTELCPFIATSGPPSELLEYFRYTTSVL